MSSGPKRLDPAAEYAGAQVRPVEYEDVLRSRWDIEVGQLLDEILVDKQGFEVSLRQMDMTVVQFRSRVYRHAKSKGLRVHIVQTKQSLVLSIYSHEEEERCDLCHNRQPVDATA